MSGLGDRLGRSVLWSAIGAMAVLAPSAQVAMRHVGTSTGPRAIYEPLTPARILDTRKPGQGPAISGGPTNERLVQVTGKGGVPADATAVVANVTVVQPSSNSYLTLYPAGAPRPGVSNIHFLRNQTLANLVTVKLGAGGAIRILNSTGTVHVLLDVAGYYRGHDHDDRYDPRSPTLLRLPGDAAPAANGLALVATMAGILDASASKPYVVALGPGIYDVGVAGLDVKPFVELQGSGEDRSVLTAPGSPDLNPSDGGIYATVRLPGESSLRDLTVRNTGGASTIAVGVEIGDGTTRVSDVTIEVSGGSDDNLGIAPNRSAPAPRLRLDRGTIEVVGGGGIGQKSSSDDFDLLDVRNSRIAVTGGGFGIGADVSRTGDSDATVTNTQISVAGGGTGLGVTASGDQIFSGVSVTVTGGTSTLGVGGSGSGFRPTFLNSTITVSGGSTSNKGFDGNLFFSVRLQASQITATGTGAIAMELGLGTTDSGDAFVDSSVLSATTIFNSINADTKVKVGASKLVGTTLTNGAGSFVCVASYKSDYTALSSTCT